MPEETFNAQVQMRRAQEAVDQTARHLHDTLVYMSAHLVPFPYFLGSTEVQAIEAEPGGAARADRGCIVVCPDGEMYEFTMKFDSPGGVDLGMDRDDSVKRIELPQEEYIVYAHNAIKEMAEVLEAQEARARKYSF